MRRTGASVYEPEDAPVTVFETGDFWSNTIRIRPVGSTAEPRTIYTSDKFQADAIFRSDRMYFRTNRDAPNWKLMAASYANPEFADWTTLIPEGATVLDEVAVTRTGIVVARPRGRARALALYGLDGKRLRDLEPPVFGSISSLAYDLDADTRLRRPRLAHAAAVGVRACGDGIRVEAGLAGRGAARCVDVRLEAGLRAPRRTARRFRCSSSTGRT